MWREPSLAVVHPPYAGFYGSVVANLPEVDSYSSEKKERDASDRYNVGEVSADTT